MLKNQALYTKAVEESKINSKVSVRLATGSIVSTCKVLILLVIRFDEFDLEEPFIVLDMDDRYDLILGTPRLMKHELWIDWRSRTVGASHKTFVERALVGHVPSLSRDGFVHEHHIPRSERLFAGSAEAMGEQGRGSTDTLEGVEAGVASAREVATVGGGVSGSVVVTIAQEVATVGGGANGSAVVTLAQGAGVVGRHIHEGVVFPPSSEDATVGGCASRGAVVTPSQEVAVIDRSGLDGIAVEPLPKLEELNGLDELSHREFLATLKEGALEDVVIIRQEATSVELNISSVMDPEVLDDENKSHRQQRYGSAILKNPADPFYPQLKEFADVVSEDPSSLLPPDRGVRHEIDLEPATKCCTTRQWPLPRSKWTQ